VKYVARQALRMYPNQRRFGAGGNVAHAKHNALLHVAVVFAFETVDPEMAESTGEISFRYFGEHRETVLLSL
jgi:hypothetical protein